MLNESCTITLLATSSQQCQFAAFGNSTQIERPTVASNESVLSVAQHPYYLLWFCYWCCRTLHDARITQQVVLHDMLLSVAHIVRRILHYSMHL
jgi:hypothetical protein